MKSPPEDELQEAVPVEEVIDLHGFLPKDVRDVVHSYLEAALSQGLETVRLIHGRGKGVQRAQIRELLRQLPEVVDFHDAPSYLGGWGATIVTLRTQE